MDLTEKTVSSEKIFDGKILHIRRDVALLPDGQKAVREVVDHPGGVAVQAQDGDSNVLTVTQYRYPFGRTLLEIPAGKLDHPGEDPYAAGLRELREETGAVPGVYRSLGRILPSPGCYGETLHLYLAQDLKMEAQHLDEDEFLSVERVPFAEMVRRCLEGEIEDAKTVAAVLKAKILLNL